MSRLKSTEELFVGRHFDREVIVVCVHWYLRFKLSLRDLPGWSLAQEHAGALVEVFEQSDRTGPSKHQAAHCSDARLQFAPEPSIPASRSG
jgi:hypothetical protein